MAIANVTLTFENPHLGYNVEVGVKVSFTARGNWDDYELEIDGVWIEDDGKWFDGIYFRNGLNAVALDLGDAFDEELYEGCENDSEALNEAITDAYSESCDRAYDMMRDNNYGE